MDVCDEKRGKEKDDERRLNKTKHIDVESERAKIGIQRI